MADLFHNWKTRKVTVQIIKLIYAEVLSLWLLRWAVRGHNGKEQWIWWGSTDVLFSLFAEGCCLCLQQCPQPKCGACQLSWHAASQRPPSALEQRRQQRCSCLGTPWCQGWKRSKWVLVLLPPKPSDDASQSFWWCRCAGNQVPGNFGLAQAENQVRASSCSAPAAVPRMHLFSNFTVFSFF